MTETSTPTESLTIVLLPGMDGTGLMFGPLVEALGGVWTSRIVRYPAKEVLGYEGLEEVARKALPTEGDYLLLGESFSGPIAVSLAASADERLRGLILVCSFVRSPIPLGTAIARPFLYIPASMIPARLVELLLLGRFRHARLGALLRRALSQVGDSVLRGRMVDVLSVDVSEKLRQVSARMLYLRATEDRLVSRAASVLLAKLRPDARIVDIAGPHCLLQASSAECVKAIRDFVEHFRLGPNRER